MKKIFRLYKAIGVFISCVCFTNFLPVATINAQDISNDDTSSSTDIYIEYDEPSKYGLVNEHYVDENGNSVEFNLIPKNNGLKKATNLPAKFDLRDVDGKSYVTSAKNQFQTGTCWAHASIGSVESNMIMQGMADTSIDLSEAHLVWFGQGKITTEDENDPLYLDGKSIPRYNKGLDKFITYNDNGTSNDNNAGGWYQDTINTLASWKGVVYENDTYTISDAMTFAKNHSDTFIDESQRYNSIAHLTNAYSFDSQDYTNIKQQLMKTGAMYFSYYTSDEKFYNYYNPSNYSYYQNEGTNIDANHAVLLVGWDDNYSKENFRVKPETDGAWICKNSWGTNFGDDGYFYISYCDQSIDEICSFEVNNTDFYNSIYQYDGIYSHYLNKEYRKASNVFQAKKDDNISAVSFYTTEASTEYEISIYKLNNDYTSPVDGTLLDTVIGTQEFAGYHTVSLNNIHCIKKNEYFSVIVSFPNDDNNRIAIDDHCYGENTSYVYYNGTWYNRTNNNICIKAFGTDGIAINEENFPDVIFRNYVQKCWDKNSNYTLDGDELNSIQSITLPKTVTDCTGVEYFTNLKYFNGSNCLLLTKLDLSNNNELVYLNLGNCSLENLVVNSDNLTYLDCSNNKLKELNLENTSNLKSLYINNNEISKIDVSNCADLNSLVVENNPLICLDLLNNPIIKSISDVGLLRNLTQTTCNPLEFEELDTSKIVEITGANIIDNKIYPTDTKICYTYQCNDNITADFTLTLPSIEHNYKYVSVDENSHSKICASCGNIAITSEKHTLIDNYDDTSHWQECSICGEKFNIAPHSFENDCDKNCNNCEYSRKANHVYENKYNDYYHWQECSICGDEINMSSHKYTQMCDDTSHWKQCSDCDSKINIATHTYNQKYNATTHWQQCTICNYKLDVETHTYKSNYNNTTHWQECSTCGSRKNVVSHTFDNDCDTSCNDCDYTRTVTHQYELKYNNNAHWQECSVCGKKIDITAHIFDNDCDTSCKDCDYIRTVTHQYELKYNNNAHWQECSVCGKKADITAHIFDNDCDTSCRDCDYIRTITHQYEFKYNDNAHWQECSVCGKIIDITGHSYILQHDDTSHWQECSDCGSKIDITNHTYELQYNDTSHWQECSTCGNKIDVIAHVFNNECDPSCKKCDYTRSVSHTYDTNWDFNSTTHWRECSTCGTLETASHEYSLKVENGVYQYICVECGYSKSEFMYDFNKDGKLNSIDMLILKKYIFNILEPDTSLDLNNDGKFNMFDYLILKNQILNN